MAICLIGRKKLCLLDGYMPDRRTQVGFTLRRYGIKKLCLLDGDMPDRQQKIVFTIYNIWQYTLLSVIIFGICWSAIEVWPFVSFVNPTDDYFCGIIIVCSSVPRNCLAEIHLVRSSPKCTLSSPKCSFSGSWQWRFIQIFRASPRLFDLTQWAALTRFFEARQTITRVSKNLIHFFSY